MSDDKPARVLFFGARTGDDWGFCPGHFLNMDQAVMGDYLNFAESIVSEIVKFAKEEMERDANQRGMTFKHKWAEATGSAPIEHVRRFADIQLGDDANSLNEAGGD